MARRPDRSGNPAVRSGAVPVPAAPPPSLGSDELALPPDGAEYPQVLRGETYEWGRSLLGVVAGLALFALLVPLVSQLVVFVGWVLTAADSPYGDYSREAYAFERPVGLLAAHLGLASAIPIAAVLMLVVHQVRPRWLFSVQPRTRWRYLLLCLVVALVTLNGVYLLSTVAEGRPPVAVQPDFWLFLVVILLTAPLQAVAEEVFFRGYLMQALGSLVRAPWFGVVLSSLVFAALHGSQNLPLFVERVAFGLLAAVLVWRTGGLEAGIAAHVVNNVFAYLIAGLTTSVAAVRAIDELTWLQAGFHVGGFALFAGLAYLVFRRLGLRRQVALPRLA